MVDAWRGSKKQGDGFAELGGHSAYHEAPEVSLIFIPLICSPLQEKKDTLITG